MMVHRATILTSRPASAAVVVVVVVVRSHD